MGRPVGIDWLPLGYLEDPVQGDPEQVTGYASQLRYGAIVLREQNVALRQIAANGTEVGQHADKIRTLAQTLSGTLLEVADRYDRVASALYTWAPQLAAAQAASWQTLDDVEIPYALIYGPQSHLSTAEEATAQEQLADARAQLARIVAQRDDDAAMCSQLIGAASNDGLTDSWWDDFLSFVNEYAWLLKDVAEALEVAAAALAVVALFVSGGWLVVAAIALTSVALADRVLLAATGNGSWLDVAVDAAALVTVGFGGEILDSAKGIGDVAEQAGRRTRSPPTGPTS